MPRRAAVRPDEPGRERILESALALFADRGYDATSIADIAAHADLAKSVLYHHFGSKAELYREALEGETAALLDQVDRALPADPHAPRLRPGVEAYLTFLAERPATWRLLLRESPHDPQLAELHRRLDAERGQALASALATETKLRAAPVHVELAQVAVRTYARWWLDNLEVPRDLVVNAILDVIRASARRIP